MGVPRLKFFDWAVLFLGIALTAGSVFWAYAGAGIQGRVSIQGSEGRWLYPLDGEGVFSITGPLGDTVVEIREGGARVLSSPCTNQTCVAAGRVHRHGQWLACLPNGVLVRVEGAGEGEIDAASW